MVATATRGNERDISAMAEKLSRQSFSELSHRERYLEVRLTSVEQYRIDNQGPLARVPPRFDVFSGQPRKNQERHRCPIPSLPAPHTPYPRHRCRDPGAFDKFNPAWIHAGAAYA